MATGGVGTASSPQAIPPHPSHRGAPAPPAGAVSPPSKRELASWWKKFRKQEKVDEKGRTYLVRYGFRSHHTVDTAPGIFGVPLAESIRYANVAISLTNEQGESFIYGYVPIVVAKCGVFLKEKGIDAQIL
jgi:GTPase-activating protein SAC7